MTENTPTLQRIHDRFDTYERYPYTDHSMISKINIGATNPDRYTVTTYPGGCGSAYDGLVLDIEAAGGIFTDDAPARVQTSRDMGGLMVLSVEDATEDEETLELYGTVTNPPKIEGLVLPGDDGFELFAELQTKLAALQEPVESTISTLGINMRAQGLTYSETGGSTSFDHERKVTTHWRGLAMTVANADQTISVKLDGTSQEPFSGRTIGSIEPPSLMVFRSGVAELTTSKSTERLEIGLESLVAFAGLHSQISELYR